MAEDKTPRDLSATARPFPVVPFPASWLALFGGLSVRPAPGVHVDPVPASAEPGQGPTDPLD